MTPAILVVDDEKDLVTTYERLLRRQGYRVISAGSCQEGLMIIATQPLALVIADLRLPDGDGLDVVQAARARPAALPVIVVTGFTSADTRHAVLAAGAAACIAKPFSAAALTRLVDGILNG